MPLGWWGDLSLTKVRCQVTPLVSFSCCANPTLLAMVPSLPSTHLLGVIPSQGNGVLNLPQHLPHVIADHAVLIMLVLWSGGHVGWSNARIMLVDAPPLIAASWRAAEMTTACLLEGATLLGHDILIASAHFWGELNDRTWLDLFGRCCKVKITMVDAQLSLLQLGCGNDKSLHSACLRVLPIWPWHLARASSVFRGVPNVV